MTVVVNSGSTAVVVGMLVLAATVAAVLIAELIAVLSDSGSGSTGSGRSGSDSGWTSGCGNCSGDQRRRRMRDGQVPIDRTHD